MWPKLFLDEKPKDTDFLRAIMNEVLKVSNFARSTFVILTFCQCISSYKHVIFMHGLLGSASEFKQMLQWLQEVRCAMTGT